MPQILCIYCFITLLQLGSSNVLFIILISDYDLLLEKTIGQSPSLGDLPDTPYSRKHCAHYR